MTFGTIPASGGASRRRAAPDRLALPVGAADDTRHTVGTAEAGRSYQAGRPVDDDPYPQRRPTSATAGWFGEDATSRPPGYTPDPDPAAPPRPEYARGTGVSSQPPKPDAGPAAGPGHLESASYGDPQGGRWTASAGVPTGPFDPSEEVTPPPPDTDGGYHGNQRHPADRSSWAPAPAAPRSHSGEPGRGREDRPGGDVAGSGGRAGTRRAPAAGRDRAAPGAAGSAGSAGAGWPDRRQAAPPRPAGAKAAPRGQGVPAAARADQPRRGGASPDRSPRRPVSPVDSALDEVSFTGTQSAVDEDGKPLRGPQRPRAGAGRTGSARPGSEPRTGPRTGPRSRPADSDGMDSDGDVDVLDRSPKAAQRSSAAIAVRLLIVAIVFFVGFSVGQALAAPGDASMTSRLAGWARDHYLGFIVD